MSICQVKPPSPIVDDHQHSPSQPSPSSRSSHTQTSSLAPPIAAHSGVFKGNITVLKSVDDLVQLLQWYYDQKQEGADPFRAEATFFPWLHHLGSPHQRQFFVGDANCCVVPPLTCNLITVECSPTPDSQSTWRLINSVPVEDLLTVPPQPSQTQISNRNFSSQLSLMAQTSSLLLYGPDSGYLHRCAQLLKPSGCGTIFVCTITLSNWSAIPKSLWESPLDSKLLQAGLLTKSPPNPTRPHRFCPLLAYEQALLFAIHGTSRLFDHLVVGTADDFSSVCKSNFKLIIECHDSVVEPPSYKTLMMVAQDWLRQIRNTHYYFEFPSGNYSRVHAPAFVNTIKIMYDLLHSGAPIYLFSFDGFTGVSLFVVAMAKVVWNTSIENAIIELVTRCRVRLYLFKSDYAFLKDMEPYLDEIPRNKSLVLLERLPNIAPIHQVSPSEPSQELQPDPYIIHPVKERGVIKPTEKITQTQTQTPPQTPVVKPLDPPSSSDWFQPDSDINFPATILENELYLGSWLHASSYTITGAFNIERIISLGDCPRWCSPLVSAGQYTELWRYDEISVLEIDCTDVKDSPPSVKSVIFLHNFNDDGRDSLLPFLFKCPSSVKAKLGLEKGGCGSKVRPRPRPCPRTLVHCRIGVSRSASLVIASLMVKFNLSLVAAYLYVRVQRFNIIIQPNLKLMYSLWLWEKHLHGGVLAWEVWASWIDSLNRHYIDVE